MPCRQEFWVRTGWFSLCPPLLPKKGLLSATAADWRLRYPGCLTSDGSHSIRDFLFLTFKSSWVCLHFSACWSLRRFCWVKSSKCGGLSCHCYAEGSWNKVMVIRHWGWWLRSWLLYLLPSPPTTSCLACLPSEAWLCCCLLGEHCSFPRCLVLKPSECPQGVWKGMCCVTKECSPWKDFFQVTGQLGSKRAKEDHHYKCKRAEKSWPQPWGKEVRECLDFPKCRCCCSLLVLFWTSCR